MFQFTTETIINSAFDSNRKTPKFFADGKQFVVTRVGKFNPDCCSKVTRTVYAAPSIESLTNGLNTPAGVVTGLNGGSVLRLDIKLKRVDSYRSDYANDMTYNSKQLDYEITLGGVSTAATTDTLETIAKKFIAVVNKEVSQSDNAYIDIKWENNALVISCVDPFQKFVSAEIQLVHTPLNSTTGYYSLTGLDTYETVVDLIATASEFVAGNPGFGTFFQLVKNHRLPTQDNTHWLANNREERPVPGGKYNQYAVTQSIVRDNMGLSAVGMQVTSVTNHIFYVLDTLAADFEAALKAAKFEVVDLIKANGTYIPNAEVQDVDLDLWTNLNKDQLTAGTKQINFTIEDLPKSSTVTIKQANAALAYYYPGMDPDADGYNKVADYVIDANGNFEDGTNVYSVLGMPGEPIKIDIFKQGEDTPFKTIEYTVA